MEVYIYTVTDRQTGEELFKGLAGQCAKFLSCSEDYVRNIAKRQDVPLKTRFGHLKVERHLADMPQVKCEGCGVVIPNAGSNRKWCPECSRQRGIEQARRYRQEHRPVQGQQQVAGDCLDVPQTQEQRQKHCKGCVYLGGHPDYRTCNYIFIEDKRRPCPPGKDCTVKKLKKNKGG